MAPYPATTLNVAFCSQNTHDAVPMSTETEAAIASDVPSEPPQQPTDGNPAVEQPAAVETPASAEPQPEAPQPPDNDGDFAVIELSTAPQNPAELLPSEPPQMQTSEQLDTVATESPTVRSASPGPEAGQQLVMPTNWPTEQPQSAIETKPKPKQEPEPEPEPETVVEEEQAEIDPNTLEELDLKKIRSDLLVKAVPHCCICLLIAGALIFVIYYTYNQYNYYSQQVSANQGTSTSTICFTLTSGSQYCTNTTSTTTTTTGTTTSSTSSSTTASPSVDLNSLQNSYIITLAFFYISAICTGFSLTFVIVIVTIALDKYEQSVKANDRIKRLKAAAPKMNLFDALFKNVKQEQADAVAEVETETPDQVAPVTQSRPASRVQSAKRATTPTNQPSTETEAPPQEQVQEQKPIQRVSSARSNRSKLNSRPPSAARIETQEPPSAQGVNTPTRAVSKRPSIASPVRVSSPPPNVPEQTEPIDQKQLPEIQA